MKIKWTVLEAVNATGTVAAAAAGHEFVDETMSSEGTQRYPREKRRR